MPVNRQLVEVKSYGLSVSAGTITTGFCFLYNHYIQPLYFLDPSRGSKVPYKALFDLDIENNDKFKAKESAYISEHTLKTYRHLQDGGEP